MSDPIGRDIAAHHFSSYYSEGTWKEFDNALAWNHMGAIVRLDVAIGQSFACLGEKTPPRGCCIGCCDINHEVVLVEISICYDVEMIYRKS